MKETLKSVFIGLYVGLMMVGFVLSIVEVRLALASKEDYGLIVLYVIVMLLSISILVYFIKKGISNITLIIGVLTAVAIIIGDLIVILDLMPKS